MKRIVAWVVVLAFLLMAWGSPAVVFDKKTASQNLASGALSASYVFSDDGELLWVSVHASGATTETITVTLNSVDGANYDTLIKSASWVAETSYFWAPTYLPLRKGDAIDVAVTNVNLTNTVYVTICVGY